MTLATRCPHCGTTFRVVSDQLKLRKGLVKCGKCLHVFNGIEFLHYFSETTNPAAADTVPQHAPQTARLTTTTDDAHAAGASHEPYGASAADEPVPANIAPEVRVQTRAATTDIGPEPLAHGAVDARSETPGSLPAAIPAPIDGTPVPDDEPRPGTQTPEPAAQIAEIIAPVESVDTESAPQHDALPAEQNPPVPAAATDPAAASVSISDIDTAADESPARAPWYARLGHSREDAPAPQQFAQPTLANAAVEATDREVAPTSSDVQQELDAIVQMRERVARARVAAQAQSDNEDEAATLSPLTLIDVARQPAEPLEDRFEELPAFLRERRRTPRWLRAVLALSIVIGFGALLAQFAYVYRAEIATEFPALRGPLTATCQALPDNLRCDVELPRHITPLRVVSADLQPGEPGTFNLVVSIHNDDSMAMAYPAFDIILTDVRNQVLVRRVIGADEYLGALRDAGDRRRAGLPGNADTSVTVPLRLLDESIVGYTVGIFYP